MFYDKFKALCDEKGISVSRACLEIGLSRSIAAKWKNTKTNPSAEVIPKIARYFGVTADYLLDAESEKKPTDFGGRPTDDEIKFALFGGGTEITDSMYEEVKRFAQMVRLREEAEKRKK